MCCFQPPSTRSALWFVTTALGYSDCSAVNPTTAFFAAPSASRTQKIATSVSPFVTVPGTLATSFSIGVDVRIGDHVDVRGGGKKRIAGHTHGRLRAEGRPDCGTPQR